MKYGGPFTTEQVEDVKTLFRVTVVLFLGCTFSATIIMPHYFDDNVRVIMCTAIFILLELLSWYHYMRYYFYCTQVPSSMFSSCMFGFCTLLTSLSSLVLLPFKLKSIDWGTGTLSCGSRSLHLPLWQSGTRGEREKICCLVNTFLLLEQCIFYCWQNV